MGNALQIECNTCGNTIFVCEGFGISEMIATQSIPFEMNQEFLYLYQEYPTIIEKTKEWIQNNEVKTSESRHRIYKCTKCKLTYDRFWFSFHNDKEKFQLTFFCKSCDGKLNLLKKENPMAMVDEITKTYRVIGCPECNSHDILDSDIYVMTLYD